MTMSAGTLHGRGACRAAFAVALALAFGQARVAAADGLRRLDAAWLLPAGQVATAIGAGQRSAGNGAWGRAGQTRLFGQSDLQVRRLAAGLAGPGGGWALEGGWESAGTGALRDDRLDGRLAVGRRVRVGARMRWRRLQPGPGPRLQDRNWDLEVGATTAVGPLGGVQADFAWPLVRTGDSALAAEPVTRLRLALAGQDRAVALGLEVGADGRPAIGWEALCALGRGLGLAWRVDRASGAMGTALYWRRGVLRLRTSHLAHPDLGLTHRFELTFGTPESAPW